MGAPLSPLSIPKRVGGAWSGNIFLSSWQPKATLLADCSALEKLNTVQRKIKRRTSRPWTDGKQQPSTQIAWSAKRSAATQWNRLNRHSWLYRHIILLVRESYPSPHLHSSTVAIAEKPPIRREMEKYYILVPCSLHCRHFPVAK